MASVTRSLPSAPICPTQSVTSVEDAVRPRTDSYIRRTKPSLVPPALDRNSPELRNRRWTSSTVARPALIVRYQWSMPPGSGSRPRTSVYACRIRNRMYSALLVSEVTSAGPPDPPASMALQVLRPLGSTPRRRMSSYMALTSARLLEACAVAEAPRDGPDVGERVV